LDRYYKALDKALMRYHETKMEEINKTITEYWQVTYKGNDIETIQIKSDTELTGNRRSHNYRLVLCLPIEITCFMDSSVSCGVEGEFRAPAIPVASEVAVVRVLTAIGCARSCSARVAQSLTCAAVAPPDRRQFPIDPVDVGGDVRVFAFKPLERKSTVENFQAVANVGEAPVKSGAHQVLASLVVRMALAETFCHNCGILALDEPTSNLDQRQDRDC